jgi:hypothetical protein
MVLAFAYLEPTEFKRRGSSVSKDHNLSEARLSQARFVLRVLPERSA